MTGPIRGFQPFINIQNPATPPQPAPPPRPPPMGPELRPYFDSFTPAPPKKPLVSLTGGTQVSMQMGQGGISAGTTLEGGVQVGGKPLSLTVGAYSEIDAGYANAAGMTTFSVEATVGVKAEVATDLAKVSASASASAGVRGSYEVTLPTAAAKGITSVEQAAQQLNPSFPQNLPVGTTITMRGEALVETGFEVTFKKIAGAFDFSVGDSLERAKGMAFSINKVDDKTVRVTIGPTATVTRESEAGLSVAGFEVSLADTGSVGQQQARQVDFDISTPGGMAAYQRFLASGELPGNSAATGTSNAATVEIVSGELTREVTVGIAMGEGTIDSDEYVFTHYDDGREEFQYTGVKGPATFVISGDVNDPSTHTYQATLKYVDGGSVDALSQTYPGVTGSGDTVSFTFTAEEAKQLHLLAKEWQKAIDEGRPGYKDTRLEDGLAAMANAATREEAIAVLLTPSMNNESGLVMNRLGWLAGFQNDTVGNPVLPGQVTVSQS